MDNVNSRVLVELGFKLAGETETVGNRPQAILDGTPRKFGVNQGVVVVYDAQGKPWVVSKRMLAPTVQRGEEIWWLCKWLGLDPRRDRGAYVPHSNDGGAGICNLFPELYRPEQRCYCPAGDTVCSCFY